MPFAIPGVMGRACLASGAGAAASATVINADHDLFNGDVQSGAVGVLSTTGTVWTRIDGNGLPLVDEFGTPTGVSIPECSMAAGSGPAAPSGPVLFQDTQSVSLGNNPGGDSHDLAGLIAGARHDLAVYGWQDPDAPRTLSSSFEVLHAAGTAASGKFGATSPSLPGTAGEDYVPFPGLQTLNLGGAYGLTVRTGATDTSLNALFGFPLSEAADPPVMPVPASVPMMLAGIGCLGLLASRRHPRAASSHHLG
ncbi:hypothetical protein DLJ49_12970 [Rhodovulum sp. 12E13]|uniref:hypothetical protein n=1 Tax=Rhodovulum sp. 12E13 TaxID=2203891 RepID=UPI000E197179|nr:hypothetical protein [Rhodovulum sp. 12E13]RDC71767.1 hypothetical protein DLJ49_12970 [Rhodovulum sp. 12E13]